MILEASDYQNFIFDCDGVILDSNLIKTESFREVLKNEKKELREKFIEYHLLNTGISRYDKFDYYFKNIKCLKNYKSELEQILIDFSQIVKKKLILCKLTPNIELFLKRLNTLKKNLYVISASDEEELTEIFRIRNLNVYFKRILGSPSNKIENISKLNISDVKETIFFGDSLSDYNAAMHFNFDFVYIKNYSLWKVPENIKKSSGYREINNFSFLKISN
jgi:phosphoglycolate phosphatase-like HAD superfamily hydrolase